MARVYAPRRPAPANGRVVPRSRAFGRRHLGIATAVLLAMASTVIPGSTGPAVLMVAVVIGLPHGGLDHVVAHRVFAARYGRLWWMPFLAGYLALVAGVLLAWYMVPTGMLATFLLLSIVHFGTEDGAATGDTSLAAVLAHGSVPIVVPALAHPDAVEEIFSLLAGEGGAQVWRFAAGPIAVVWVLAVSMLVYRFVRSSDRRRDGLMELGGAILLFAVARPLSAFAIYFAVVHTPRAFASLRRRLPDRERRRLIVRSLPLTGLGILIGGALLLLQSAASFQDGAIRTAFFLLGALTVPHMWLAWLSDPARMGARSRSCLRSDTASCRRAATISA